MLERVQLLKRPDYTWRNGPPDYVHIVRWRQQQLELMRNDPRLIYGAEEHYRHEALQWINDWTQTYDPRDIMSDTPAKLPFILFPKQVDLVEFLRLLVQEQQSGLIEKSRELGATWICCAFSVWLWKYYKGASIGWGSRKQEFVDELGVPDSIFEKLRMCILGLPKEFWPLGFEPKQHMTFMKIINPENGATITGEVGDNIGRGGRKTIYFKDESAHYEHPESIEGSLSENTRVQVDISSVSSFGTVFERKRDNGVDWVPGQKIAKGKTNVFVMDWRDDPRKSEEWYKEKHDKFESEGLLHIFKQEIDRDYSASLEGIIIPGDWVKAAVDAHLVLGIEEEGRWGAALDVADEGGDTNALTTRRGIVLKSIEEWGQRDTGVTTRRAVDACRMLGPVELQYDASGVGAGVKAEANRLKEDGLIPKGLQLVAWFGGAKVLWPEHHVIRNDKTSPLTKDFFQNFKAQAWWAVRRRFELTYRAVNDPYFTYNADDLISLDSTIPLLRKLIKELSQPCMIKSTSLKMQIDKKPDGAKSPNLGDSLVMNYFPARNKVITVSSEAMRRAAVGRYKLGQGRFGVPAPGEGRISRFGNLFRRRH